MLALWAQHFVPNFSPFISKLLCQSGSAASANWGKILRPFVELSGQQVFLCYALHSHFLTRNYSQWESDYRMKGEGSWKIEKKTFQKTTLNFFEIDLTRAKNVNFFVGANILIVFLKFHGISKYIVELKNTQLKRIMKTCNWKVLNQVPSSSRWNWNEPTRKFAFCLYYGYTKNAKRQKRCVFEASLEWLHKTSVFEAAFFEASVFDASFV